jgi:hypothetical protein
MTAANHVPDDRSDSYRLRLFILCASAKLQISGLAIVSTEAHCRFGQLVVKDAFDILIGRYARGDINQEESVPRRGIRAPALLCK